MSNQVAILQSLQPVLSTLIKVGLASCGGVLAQAWLVGPGDLCNSCPMRPECPSQSSCLHITTNLGFKQWGGRRRTDDRDRARGNRQVGITRLNPAYS